MKELILDAVAKGYKPLFYTKRGTVNAMAMKLQKLTKERCEPLELCLLRKFFSEEKGIMVLLEPCYTTTEAGVLGIINEFTWIICFIGKDDDEEGIKGEEIKTYEESLMQGLKEAVNLVEN